MRHQRNVLCIWEHVPEIREGTNQERESVMTFSEKITSAENQNELMLVKGEGGMRKDFTHLTRSKEILEK